MINNIKLDYSPESEGISLRETFSKVLRQVRKEKKITQKELAEKIGKSESLIRKYEKGLVFPQYDTLISIAESLDIDPLLLLCGLDYRMFKSVLCNLEKISAEQKPEQTEYSKAISEVLDSLKFNNIDYSIDTGVSNLNKPIEIIIQFNNRAFILSFDDLLYIYKLAKNDFNNAVNNIVNVICNNRQPIE